MSTYTQKKPKYSISSYRVPALGRPLISLTEGDQSTGAYGYDFPAFVTREMAEQVAGKLNMESDHIEALAMHAAWIDANGTRSYGQDEGQRYRVRAYLADGQDHFELFDAVTSLRWDMPLCRTRRQAQQAADAANAEHGHAYATRYQVDYVDGAWIVFDRLVPVSSQGFTAISRYAWPTAQEAAGYASWANRVQPHWGISEQRLPMLYKGWLAARA